MGKYIGKLNYCDLLFIENCLSFYLRRELKEMEKNRDVISQEEIDKFVDSVKDVMKKVEKIREEEE